MTGGFARRAVSERVRLGAYRRPRLDAAVGLPRLRAGLMRECANTMCVTFSASRCGEPSALATAAYLRRARRPRPLYRGARQLQMAPLREGPRAGDQAYRYHGHGAEPPHVAKLPHAKPPSPSPKRRPLNNVIFAFYRVRFPPRLRRAAGLDSAAPRAVLASAVYRLRRRFVSEGTPRAGRSRQLQPSPPPVPQRPRRTHRAPHSAAASSRIFPRRLGDEGTDLNSGVGRCAGCAAL